MGRGYLMKMTAAYKVRLCTKILCMASSHCCPTEVNFIAFQRNGCVKGIAMLHVAHHNFIDLISPGIRFGCRHQNLVAIDNGSYERQIMRF